MSKESIDSYNKRLDDLKTERSSFITQYKELSDYTLGYRGRFLVSDRNKGNKRNDKILNNTPKLSARTLASGMMTGITSPARPWFKLTSPNPELNEITEVKDFLAETESLIYKVLAASNTYNSLHSLYTELGVFGTGAMGIYEDFDNVVRCVTYTAGEYYIDSNSHGQVDTFYREFEMPVGQLVKEYGIENVSDETKKAWESNNLNAWVGVVHVIEPNDDRGKMKPLSGNFKFRSVHYEAGSRNKSKFLRESGFKEFPIVAPRWDVAPTDIYGTDCPAMCALGDIKMLMAGEKMAMRALEKLVNPAYVSSASGKDSIGKDGIQPGVTYFVDTPDPRQAAIVPIEGSYRPDLNAMLMVNDRVEQRIKRAFYEDLFLMISGSDRRQVTAREIAEKQEEKLLMLGPVLERLQQELLDPLIDRIFAVLLENGVLPEPPAQLEGQELKVDYVSVLSQAQRMVATGGIEDTIAFAANLTSVWPEARHKIDALQAIDDYANSRGAPPSLVRGDDEVQKMVEQEQQAQEQQIAMEQAAQVAQTAKTAGDVNVSENSALSQLMG